VLGEVARSVAAYAGPGAYLDVALGWVARRITTCPVRLRDERREGSGYRLRTLLSHYWHSVLTGGTRLLRAVALLGVVMAAVGFALAGLLVWMRYEDSIDVAGWTSLAVVMLITSGAILLALGVIAEYLGVAVAMAMGRPIYVIVSDPRDGPLGADADVGPVEEREPT
jgi:hypothetical protein